MSAARTITAAVVQMTSKADVAGNLDNAARLLAQASRRGAKLAVLPENFAFIGVHERDKLPFAESLEPGSQPGPIITAMAEAARRTGMILVLGGMPERGPDPDHVYNTCAVLAPDGRLVARYRKVHLFDIAIPGAAEFRESASVSPGDGPVVVDTPWAPVGLSVCYDLRFPELYRALVAGGARALVVPAAFTMHTGKDHWHVLLRARAIENQAYVLAAAQVGRANDKRHCYGHALIVDPWGIVVAEASDVEGVAVAELDLGLVERTRREMPCLGHRKM
ncbi:MAG: carbon-nitrogen hydrolase family protein [Deltaproteobacteria bacterium]|nr:carbon-nitrogen hydrolase family protein [Deltaproteobacteria bacterium]